MFLLQFGFVLPSQWLLGHFHSSLKNSFNCCSGSFSPFQLLTRTISKQSNKPSSNFFYLSKSKLFQPHICAIFRKKICLHCLLKYSLVIYSMQVTTITGATAGNGTLTIYISCRNEYVMLIHHLLVNSFSGLWGKRFHLLEIILAKY